MSIKSIVFERALPYIPGRTILALNLFFKDRLEISNNSYFIKSSHQFHYILRDRVALYRKGLTHRGQSLGKSYHLDQITFQVDDLIVDVGANVGDLLLYLPKDIRYVGFEPSPEEFSRLQLNATQKCKVFNYAVMDKNCEVSLYLNSKSADSSIFEPPTHSEVIKVQGVRLDQIVKERVKLLKVDAEGGELEVLIGCEQALNRIEYISIDCGFEKGKNKESTFISCLKLLQSNDFEILEVGANFRFLFTKTKID